MSRPLSPIQVTLEECNGSFDRMLRRFIRRVKEEGVIREYRASLSYDKPSVARRRKRAEARREKSRRTTKNAENIS